MKDQDARLQLERYGRHIKEFEDRVRDLERFARIDLVGGPWEIARHLSDVPLKTVVMLILKHLGLAIARVPQTDAHFVLREKQDQDTT